MKCFLKPDLSMQLSLCFDFHVCVKLRKHHFYHKLEKLNVELENAMESFIKNLKLSISRILGCLTKFVIHVILEFLYLQRWLLQFFSRPFQPVSKQCFLKASFLRRLPQRSVSPIQQVLGLLSLLVSEKIGSTFL